MIRNAAAALLLTSAPLSALHAGSSAAPFAGEPSQVLVLGTPHLSQFGDELDPRVLDPLIDRLATWKPQAIAIESLSGTQCDLLERNPARYEQTAKDYCGNRKAARAATGLDVPAATAEADRLLAKWSAAPDPAQRRHLAAVFLAGGEPASALVQWLRLPATERREGDGIDAELVKQLERTSRRMNENYQVAARLAARLGHERVYSVDDHTSDENYPDQADYEAAIQKGWSNPGVQQFRKQVAPLDKAALTSDGMMNLYRFYNSKATARLNFKADFGAQLLDPSPQHFGRRYVGWWETRNLRMVANIREVAARTPGSRTLAIVGASHKPYYERYLSQMHDLRIASTDPVLR